MAASLASTAATAGDMATSLADAVAEAAAANVATSFENASGWHNWTVWTAQRLPFLNVTRLAPSLDSAMWRKLGRLGSYISIPGAIDSFGSLQQRVIPEATDAAAAAAHAANAAFRAASSVSVAGSAASAAAAGAAGAAAASAGGQASAGTFSSSAALLSTESARGLGSLFSYATSKWALCCVATAVILNRTYIFAATRRRVRLPWTVRLLIRTLPVMIFLLQARRLLQCIQCQTSPDFAVMRWGDPTKHSDLLFSEDNPLLHSLSAHLLLNPTDRASCQAVRMIPSEQYSVGAMRGSLSLLWPLFLSFCASHFVETLSCAVQGRPVAAETGMTVFEHSLAFAEADAAISSQLGWGSFVTPAASTAKSSTLAAVAATATTIAAAASGASGGAGGAAAGGVPISRATILNRVNTPPEVLLLAFLSAMSHVTSHVLGVFNLQAKFRLLSTGFWALCFMGSIVWSAVTFSLDDPSGQSLLRFPTVAIVGFIPHMLVLVGILVCCFIYGSALLLAAASLEPDAGHGNGNGNGHVPLSFRERLAHAHANMQANLPMGNLRVGMEMDFYTALLRVGFDAITMASEAVYLNEDRRVNLRLHTWLEDERYNELQELRSRWMASDLPGSRFDTMGATGLVPTAGSRGALVTSGYARERVAQQPATGKTGERVRPIRTGIGATERSGRWVMAVEYLVHVARLMLSFAAMYVCRALAGVGIRSQPQWLRRLVQRRKAARGAGETGDESSSDGYDAQPANEWLNDRAGSSILIPRRNHVDVEYEVRRRLGSGRGDLSGSVRRDEREIDGKLYQWWAKGGWWGDVDASGDYEPSIAADDDATSVISATDDQTSESGWESADDEDNGYSFLDGQRTPTQQMPGMSYMSYESREGTPFSDMPMQMTELARLLDPRSPEDRAEAQTMAAHLKSDGIMTRAVYAQFRQRQRAELLATSRFGVGARRMADFHPGARLSPDEEARLLEQLLLSRRACSHDNEDEPRESSWATGAAGLGPDGPQCVVCQSAPRTIIVWPCRCLSLCDDCRVSLAMNNFDKCVCCRREVASFSRIYVP